MDTVERLRNYSQLTPEILKEEFLKKSPTSVYWDGVNGTNADYLWSRMVEIQLLLVEDGNLIGLCDQITDAYLSLLSHHLWVHIWDSMPKEVQHFLPDFAERSLAYFYASHGSLLDAWAWFLYNPVIRAQMPPWRGQIDGNAKYLPFGAYTSDNALSAACSETLFGIKQGNFLWAARSAQWAWHSLAKGEASNSSRWMYREALKGEAFRRDIFATRYLFQCLKTKTIPVLSELVDVYEGRTTYEYDSPSELFMW